MDSDLVKFYPSPPKLKVLAIVGATSFEIDVSRAACCYSRQNFADYYRSQSSNIVDVNVASTEVVELRTVPSGDVAVSLATSEFSGTFPGGTLDLASRRSITSFLTSVDRRH